MYFAAPRLLWCYRPVAADPYFARFIVLILNQLRSVPFQTKKVGSRIPHTEPSQGRRIIEHHLYQFLLLSWVKKVVQNFQSHILKALVQRPPMRSTSTSCFRGSLFCATISQISCQFRVHEIYWWWVSQARLYTKNIVLARVVVKLPSG